MNTISSFCSKLKKIDLCLYLVFAFGILGCISNREKLIICDKEKELFTSANTYKLSIKSIKSAKDFGNFAVNAADTMHDCHLVCGFSYNYEDSSLNPNINPSKNILIPCLHVFSNRCTVDKLLQPELSILMLPSDSLIIINKNDTTLYNVSYDKNKIYKCLLYGKI